MSADSASAESGSAPSDYGRVCPQLGQVRDVPEGEREASRTNASAELNVVIQINQGDVVLQVGEGEACKECERSLLVRRTADRDHTGVVSFNLVTGLSRSNFISLTPRLFTS